MSGPEFEYDAFISYAGDDRVWSEKLAQRLRDEGIRVWFDKWRLQPGDHLLKRINDGIETSRKMIAVWSGSYFRDDKVWTLAESYGQTHSDVLAEQRPLIPLLLDDCKIPPTFKSLLYIDCRKDSDFDLRFRELVRALDLPRRDDSRSNEFIDIEEHGFDPARRGRLAASKGNRFEEEVAALYRLLGFDVKQDLQISGFQIDLTIEEKRGGLVNQAVVECKNKRVTADDRNQILAQQNVVQKTLPAYRWLVVSSQGFDGDAREALTAAGVGCTTYAELLRELVPLDFYVNGLIKNYEAMRDERWGGDDWFIRPDLKTDITYENKPALEHIGKWLGDSRGNLMVVLGDLGAGKSTLADFLAYDLAKSFREDPIRLPAPVLIPLKDVRKENSLESIVISHFSKRGLQGVDFRRFIHLVRIGRIILFFDAFDEMADRVRWEVTQSNFRELRRAAEFNGKVILTCRTHYFKDRNEQVTVIGEGPKLSEIETDLYRELRKQSRAEVVYLEEFDDEKILGYLSKARPNTVAEDWKKIQEIHNLQELAHRPLLLDMIVKSLGHLDKGQQVNAANLYSVYTNIWVEREEEKGRFLDKRIKLGLMLELAWTLWNEGAAAIHYRELLPFLKKLAPDKTLGAGEEELLDVARELQGASFLKRADDAGNFAFIHRSFMEFFLARKLFDAMSEPEDTGIRAALDTNRLDRKVIYFLTLVDNEDRMAGPLQRILMIAYTRRVSENALQILYWSERIRSGMEDRIPDPALLREKLKGRIPAGAFLQYAQLQEIVLEAADLWEVSFDRADLTGANLNHAKVSDCSFESAKLTSLRMDNAEIRNSSFREADLTGASFDEARLIDSDLTGAIMTRAALPLAAGGNLRSVARAAETRAAGTLQKNLTAVVQSGPGSAVYAVAYSRDGELVASGCADGIILIYRVEDGRLLRALEGHTSGIMSVAFSPDGQTLASGGNDETVRLWDLNTGAPLRLLKGHTDGVSSVAFSPDRQTLASGGYDRTVRLWDLNSGSALRLLVGHTNGVLSVALSSDGQTLASGGYDSVVRLWDLNSGSILRILEGHTFGVNSVAISPDGQTLASGGDDKSVGLWDLNSASILRILEGHTNRVNSVAFSPDGQTLASGGFDKTVRLWDRSTGSTLRILEGHTFGVNSVVFSPNEQTLASGGDDSTVRLWDLNAGSALSVLNGHANGIRSVAFSPDGQTLASGGYDKTVRLWDLNAGTALRILEGHTFGVNSVAFSPDGQSLASGGADTTVRLWDLNSGSALRLLDGHEDWVRSVAFSPDGQTLASGGYDKTVRLWDLNSGSALRILEGHTYWVNSVAFSPDGQTLASGGGGDSVGLWDLNSGSALRLLDGHGDWIRSVALSPDGQTLASGGDDNTVKLWDLDSGSALHLLEGHTNWVNSVAFSPDGQTLASGGYDNSVRLWSVKSGTAIRTLQGTLGSIWSICFAPNGKYLIAAGSAGRLQFWDIETGQTFLYRYSFGSGEWLDLLPDGRFDASPEGMRYLAYTEPGSLASYTAEQLVKEFHDPRAVREALSRYTG